MSNDVSKNYSQSPQKRINFLERVEHYVNKRPKWTPAGGALLVNGVIPPEGCKNIPETGVTMWRLDDPDQPATQEQLTGAKRILQDYLDHVRDGDLPPGDEVLSDDFLKWCYDSDPAPWNAPKLPEFLRHLYFPGTNKHPFAMSVADEIASLRIMAAAAAVLQNQPARHAKDTPSSNAQSIGAESYISENSSALYVLEQQIRAIEAGAQAKEFDPKAIPRGGKKVLLAWCLDNHPDLFKSNSKGGDSKFMEAWKEASRQKRVVHQNRDTHARRK